ncbi:excalibur calcium-binding domain-containing protein [Exiguobacterium aurantiacum]|uniref:Excalibur calcium-binding domain-containing protein n=1 Tax=Exiguobacterium aurantiacum TaxID=33987 RepID=A0A377FR48_9BACL|nr:excalibur calcium-binding domain-containing protein [Exiguobacterium aurantiacum]STO07299.1 Uncharacterised protein [Exiguobacterium aurantiacum]
MTVMTWITAACVAGTISIIFIWLADEPVERVKLQLFATALYLVLVAATFYFHQLERDFGEVAQTLSAATVDHDEQLLALEEKHADALAWQAIQIERDVTEKLEARYAAREDTMKDHLFLKVVDLEEVIKTQRGEIYALEDRLREAEAMNEELAFALADAERLIDTTTEETEDIVFFETYGSCEDLNAVYPDGVPLEHDAYLLTFDTDFDGVACGQNDTR